MLKSLPSPTAQIHVDQVSLISRQIVPGDKTDKKRLPMGAQYLLQDLSLEIFRGDRIAIVGPSGAGKTSLLRLLNRLSDPFQGTIYLEGQDIRRIPVTQFRQSIPLVLQESKLLGMTVEEALSYPLILRHLPRSTIQPRIRDCLEQLRIPSEWLERTEAQLSVGQRQLVAIARALVIQPPILLLDEPTSSLDAGRGDNLMEILRTFSQTHQTTILMVNHQLNLAEQFSDRLLYLQQGKLLQDQATCDTNWAQLHQTLLQAEKQAAQEWE